MKGILLSSGRHSGGNTLRAAAKGGEQGGAGFHPTHHRLHRWGVSVSPAPPGGTPCRRWGGSRFGGMHWWSYQTARICSSSSTVIFPACIGICFAWSRISLDAGAHECFLSAFTTVLHEPGKPLSLFLLWLSHLSNMCHGWVRLIGGINNP